MVVYETILPATGRGVRVAKPDTRMTLDIIEKVGEALAKDANPVAVQAAMNKQHVVRCLRGITARPIPVVTKKVVDKDGKPAGEAIDMEAMLRSVRDPEDAKAKCGGWIELGELDLIAEKGPHSLFELLSDFDDYQAVVRAIDAAGETVKLPFSKTKPIRVSVG